MTETKTVMAVGYFDSPRQTEAAYDPGTDVDCPVCCEPLDYPNRMCKTINCMPMGGSPRSIFYRPHKDCWEALSREEQGEFDAIAMEIGGAPLGEQDPEAVQRQHEALAELQKRTLRNDGAQP